MSGGVTDMRRRGILVALLLFALGAVAGVAGDRLWLGLGPTAIAATPMTPEALSRALDLDPADDARIRSVLDSIRVDLVRATEAGPDSLQAAAGRGRQRLEDALPADRRAGFQAWMDEHHARMMRTMGRGMMGGPGGAGPEGMMSPGMMRPDSGGPMMRR